MSSTEDPSISNLMYIPYYMPDVNFNKVLYSNNIVKNGSILISDPGDGIIDLNQKYINNFTNDYVYTPNVQSTVWNMNNTFVNNNLQYYFNGTKSNTQQSTKLGQTGIKNFNYNIIFGLTQADTSVIDWNYYGTGGITGDIILTDRIYSKLGPKLFLVNNGNYTDGTVSANGLASIKVSNASNNQNINNGNILSNMVGMTITPVDPSFNPITIDNNTTLNTIYNVWPYKVQYNNNQYYNILTNGINEALLALPKVEVSTATQYLLTTKLNPSTLDPEYSYTDLGDIIQNNYHYIVSYFDTRPTVNYNASLNFSSITSSLFNENLVQFMPLTNYNSNTCDIIHTTGKSSCMASCIPIAWTTTQPHAFPNTPIDDLEGLSPIRLEWGKNITIQAEVNYTCANMKNLSDILTGWNYYGNNFTPASSPDNTNTSRINVPYINCGLVLYVPNLNSPSYSSVYAGSIQLGQGNNINPKIYCEILESDNIITQYYITINEQRVVLSVTPDPDNDFLPKIEEMNGNYPKYSVTTIDINGIFYNINLYQTTQFPEILDLNIKNIQNVMNSYFTAVITMQNSITKSCVIDPANNTVSFYIGNNLYTLQKSGNLYPSTVTYGLYTYRLTVDSTTPQITLEINPSNSKSANTTVTIITLSGANKDNWYSSNSKYQVTNSDISLETYKWSIYFSKITDKNESNTTYSLFFNNNEYNNLQPGDNQSSIIKLTDKNNGTSGYYMVSVPQLDASPSENVNKFARYKNWLQSFIPNNCKFWNEISEFDVQGNDVTINNTDLKNYINNIYKFAVDHVNGNLDSGMTTSSLQYLLSTPACISFDNVGTSPVLKLYNSHYIGSSNATVPSIIDNNNFLGFNRSEDLTPDTSTDLIKLVNVLSVPITNALNTTHTATDTMTFRFEKPTSPSGLTDYYYIIGIYLYVTKGLQLTTAQENPHYIGFSPSTNVLDPAILQSSNGTTTGNGIPKSLSNVMVKNTTNLYTNNYQTSILMKDYLLTPSIFMSINESTGNNL